MSPFRRMKVGRMVTEVKAWNLHEIGSHGKNGSPTTCPNQAGKLPQHQAHYYSIFPGLGIVVCTARNGLETALFVERLGGVICAPDFQKSRICLATARFVEDAVEQRRADATAPVLRPDSNVVD